MSRVLARSMFKKKAPKRSAKGVGITAMLEDDVPGYAEGGEVIDDRTERERLARQLLEQNRDEGEMYQRFSEQERPRQYRPPATAGMVPPPPNPQQMQAMQMQQMAQMGMIPRFQEGGIVNAVPRQPVETPSMWSRIGTAFKNIYGGNPPLPEAATIPNAYGAGVDMRDFPLPEGGGENLFGDPVKSIKETVTEIPNIVDTMAGVPQFKAPQFPTEQDLAVMDRETRETERVSQLNREREAARKRDLPPPPSDKKTNLGGIKEERQARAAQRAMEAEAARKENMWLALMQAGLAIAGGRSPNAITNIGQGGQAGLASFMALEQQRRRDEDAAMRRDIAEREFGLQERKFQAQAPLYAAQAAYWQNRPFEDAQKRMAQQQVARSRAQVDARRAWNERLKGPYSLEYMKMNDLQKKVAEDLFLKQESDRIYQNELSAFRAGVYGGGQRDTEPSSGE